MKKIILVAVLIFSLLSSTEIAYSYFNDSSNQMLNEDNPLYVINQTIGNNSKNLIPKGSVLGVNDTYEITFKYEIVIEKGVNIESDITNAFMENTQYTSEELMTMFNFDVEFDHIEDITIKQGIFSDTTEGQLVNVCIKISMNNANDFNNSVLMLGGNLNFTYRLRVSKA